MRRLLVFNVAFPDPADFGLDSWFLTEFGVVVQSSAWPQRVMTITENNLHIRTLSLCLISYQKIPRAFQHQEPLSGCSVHGKRDPVGRNPGVLTKAESSEPRYPGNLTINVKGGWTTQWSFWEEDGLSTASHGQPSAKSTRVVRRDHRQETPVYGTKIGEMTHLRKLHVHYSLLGSMLLQVQTRANRRPGPI